MKNKKKNKKNNFLIENYKKSWEYICESRKFIYFVVGIFFIFTLVGFFVPAPKEISEMIFDFIEELLRLTEGMGVFELINFIFWNNLQASAFGFVFGIFFGIVPILIAIFNGYLLGFVFRLVVAEQGVWELWKILPHGIFELPAIWISLGLGLKMFSFLFYKNKAKNFKKFFLEGLRVFIFVVVLLLIVAAVIEGVAIGISG